MKIGSMCRILSLVLVVCLVAGGIAGLALPAASAENTWEISAILTEFGTLILAMAIPVS